MMLALGRRSDLAVVKYSSLSFIEFWRGVPLITVLFMSAVMFPMFLPDGTYVDKLIRVIVAITLFEAAYTAEVIRGGFVSSGQYYKEQPHSKLIQHQQKVLLHLFQFLPLHNKMIYVELYLLLMMYVCLEVSFY